MKKNVLILIIILFAKVCFSQTMEETKEYIILKMKNVNTEYSIIPNQKTFVYFEFYKNFLLVKEVYNINNEYGGFKYRIVNLKNIKSFNFENDKWEFKDKSFNYKTIVIDLGEEYPLCLEKNIDAIQTIVTKSEYELYKLHFSCSNPIRIKYQSNDIENEIKTTKAFKHLVKLYGGKIIDDLF